MPSRLLAPELAVIRKVTAGAQKPVERIFAGAVAKVRGRPQWRLAKLSNSSIRGSKADAFGATQGDPGLWQVQIAGGAGAIDLEQLAHAIQLALSTGNVDAIEATLRIQTLAGALSVDLTSLIWKVMANAGSAANETFATAFGINAVDLTGFNQAAVEAAQGLVGDLVTAVTEAQRQAIRDAVAAGFDAGDSPLAIASDIAGSVGLDARSASGFREFLAQLAADPPDLDAAGIQALIDGEYQSRLDARALRIARTETVRAATEAQKGLFGQAVDEGQINGDDYEHVFVAHPDACPECQDADGSTDEEAPLHPACFCGNQYRKVA